MKAIELLKLILCILPLSLVSCATLQRNPSSDKNTQVLQSLYTKNMIAELRIEQFELAQRVAQIQKRDVDYSEDINRARAQKKEVAQATQEFAKSLENGDGIPQVLTAHLQTAWRKQRESLNFRNIEAFELSAGKGPIQKYFAMDRKNSSGYELELHNIYFSQNGSSASQPFLEFKMTCDGDFKISQFLGSLNGKAGQEVQFRLYDDGFNGERIRFIPSGNLQSCQVRFTDLSVPDKVYGFKILDLEKVHPSLGLQHQMIQGCVLPSAKELGPVEELFLTSEYGSMTCPSLVNNIERIENPLEGFQAKVQALLGQRLSDEFIKAHDPFLPIDFSKAPKLDEIDATNLVFRNDYYGAIVRRLIEYHAERGTFVRILIAKVIALKKDLISFDDMVAKHSNVKVMEYKWIAPPDATLGALFSTLHKTDHVKMLITLSSEDPSKNTVVIGGRNIHDGFVFATPPDLSKYPSLVQYPGDERWAFWRDMEYRISDTNEVINLAGHFMTLWEMDSDSFYQRSLNFNLPTTSPVEPNYFKSDKPLVRHFISIPFKDRRSLERLYIQMIDSAQKELLLSTPYFNLTPGISKAFERAVGRGVNISLITRLDLKGDTADIVLSDVNKKAVNAFRDKFSIFEFTVPKEILHSKIALIDGKLSFVGSVNLNHRSFIHDTENIMMVYSPKFNQEMAGILAGYLQGARRIKDTQKLRFINKIILSIPFINDAF